MVGLSRPVFVADIGNIHVMQKSMAKLRALCMNKAEGSDVSWFAKLHDSAWLEHIGEVTVLLDLTHTHTHTHNPHSCISPLSHTSYCLPLFDHNHIPW